MARVALLTMSDGRDFVARDLTGFCREAEDAVAAALAAAGHHVARGVEPLSVSDVATYSVGRLGGTQPDRAVFHDPVSAFPHFTMAAASATSGPLLLPRAASTFLALSWAPDLTDSAATSQEEEA